MLEDTWIKVRESLQKELSEHVVQRWIEPIQPISLEDNILRLGAPDDFFLSWISDHYGSIITQAYRDVCQDREAQVVYEIMAPQPVIVGAAPVEGPKMPPSMIPVRAPIQENPLNPKYTFESFVVGPSNRFAHAASMAVAESPAKSYNPLFIYGPVGLGKTHLMQAIGHEMYRRNPRTRVLYITSEQFTNQLINAIKTGGTLKFRDKYRTLDCLLIDDIHFIAGKEATMEEFFNTFNALYDAHKQIVVSSDKPPKDISHMEERLISRFEWGLVTDIQAPDFETRTAILRKKAERENLHIDDAVTAFIADKIKSNIRELEGALIRVVAYSKLVGKQVDETVAYEVLKDMIVETEKRISVDMIQRKVAEYFDVRPSDMTSKRRSRSVAYPRHVAIYLSRELTSLSLPELGDYFGGRDHTTILHAYEKIKKDVKKDQKTKSLVDKLLSEIKR